MALKESNIARTKRVAKEKKQVTTVTTPVVTPVTPTTPIVSELEGCRPDTTITLVVFAMLLLLFFI
jgi:hypothetical protein